MGVEQDVDPAILPRFSPLGSALLAKILPNERARFWATPPGPTPKLQLRFVPRLNPCSKP